MIIPKILDGDPFLLVDSIYFLISVGSTLFFQKYIRVNKVSTTSAPSSSSSCDSCILNTASKLHRHLIICTGELSSSHWLSHLETADNTIFHSLRDPSKDNKKEKKDKDKIKGTIKEKHDKKKDKDSKEKEKSKLLISAVEYSFTEEELKNTHPNKRMSIREGGGFLEDVEEDGNHKNSSLQNDVGLHVRMPFHDIGFIYPEGVMIELPPPHDHKACKEFREELLQKDLNHDFLEKIKVGNGSLPWSKVILVCNHMSRDKRCGRAGPLAITALKTTLNSRSDVSTSGKDSIRVFGCSHIGGHKYAATLAIYPKGDWIGKVTKKNAKHVIDCAINGTSHGSIGGELVNCLRGNAFDW